MKRILDPAFRYRPSFDTDVRRTFERIRREQSASANGAKDGLDAVVGILRDIDGDRVRRRLQRGELAVEERCGHVAVLARRKA